MGACGDGSREHISKVCSQLIIGMPPLLHHEEKDEVGSKAGLLSRRRTCGNRPCRCNLREQANCKEDYWHRQDVVIDALCVAALCCASLSLPPVSTINVTRYPRADNENIRGPTSPCLLPIFFLSLSRGKELRNYSCRDAYREGGYEDYPKVGWSVVKGDRL